LPYPTTIRSLVAARSSRPRADAGTIVGKAIAQALLRKLRREISLRIHARI
jgi:hypothetical protein